MKLKLLILIQSFFFFETNILNMKWLANLYYTYNYLLFIFLLIDVNRLELTFFLESLYKLDDSKQVE